MKTRLAALSLILLAAAGCRQDMHDQPKYTAYESSAFFADERSARPIVEGTIAQGHLNEDELLYAGRIGGQPVTMFPFAVDDALMRRGRERYDIYCRPCHDGTGAGRGVVITRSGWQPPPPTFHQDRIRQMPDGQLFATITHGVRTMPSYGAYIPVNDRWAIVSYVRALQLSQGE